MWDVFEPIARYTISTPGSDDFELFTTELAPIHRTILKLLKAIYTTNAIESVNSVIRKFTRNRKIYPNEESALKLVYMAIHEASKKWTMPIHDWKQALNHCAIMFEGRMPELTSK